MNISLPVARCTIVIKRSAAPSIPLLPHTQPPVQW
uniref:Uncharacterized protein n=1 Tax=Arundo donax TaxID=35708 RepID=A0A0A9CKE4_ARUDO